VRRQFAFTGRAVNRIFSRQGHFRNRLDGSFAILARGAFVVFAGWRVSTDHEEILTRGEALVSCTCRQNGDITSFKCERPASFAAELHLAGAAGDAKNFVYSRMVVIVVVYAIAPRTSPAVFVKEVLEHCRRVELLGKTDGPSVDDQGKGWMVWNDAIILKPK
jgi:hypothetical protein